MDWQDCCRKRIVKDVQIDKEMIKSLQKASQNKLNSSKQLPLNPTTAASKFSLAYDSLRELLEALALQNSYKIYNHECYTAFLKEILHESYWGDEFDELRKTRNAVNYYAKEVSTEEAQDLIYKTHDVIKKINSLFKKMKKAVLLILKKDGKVLFARRNQKRTSLPGKWSLPSETMKENQTIDETAKHGALSELGIDLKEFQLIDTLEFNKNNEEKILYYVEADISQEPEIRKENELTELKWLSWPEFFAKHSDEEIGHGLQYLRKKFA